MVQDYFLKALDGTTSVEEVFEGGIIDIVEKRLTHPFVIPRMRDQNRRSFYSGTDSRFRGMTVKITFSPITKQKPRHCCRGFVCI